MRAVQAPIASPLSEPPPSVDHPGHPFDAIIGATFASRADLAAAAVHLPRDRAVAIRHPRVGCATAAGGIRRKRPRVTSVMVPGEAASLAAADGSQVVELRLPADSAADEVRVAYMHDVHALRHMAGTVGPDVMGGGEAQAGEAAHRLAKDFAGGGAADACMIPAVSN